MGFGAVPRTHEWLDWRKMVVGRGGGKVEPAVSVKHDVTVPLQLIDPQGEDHPLSLRGREGDRPCGERGLGRDGRPCGKANT